PKRESVAYRRHHSHVRTDPSRHCDLPRRSPGSPGRPGNCRAAGDYDPAVARGRIPTSAANRYCSCRGPARLRRRISFCPLSGALAVSKTQIIIDVLLAIGVLNALLGSLGILLMKDLYERLHYMAPQSTVSIACFAAAILIFVAVAGTAVVLTRNPLSQVIGLTFYGLLLALMFFIFQAPDVAFSQIVVGAVALPLMVLLALAKIRNREVKQRMHHER